MKLIVGLGNPGTKYEHSRHNTGFDTLDKVADAFGCDVDKEGFKGIYGRCKFFDEDIYLLKPMTFMNLSGESVSALASYFKISPENIFVIHDDMDIMPGHLKIKTNGSSGGHNGIKSIISCLGTDKFVHIRVGIGMPTDNSIDFVLGKPIKEERDLIDSAENSVVEAIKMAIKESVNKAMSLYNK